MRSDKQAIIMAGGQGTRLRPYTTVFPKALVPVGDVPILEHLLIKLKHHGFNRITLSVGHLASLIQAYVGDGRRWGLSIDYVMEHTPLGTAGPLLLLKDQLPENFLVMNADVVSDLPFDALFEQHCQQPAALATIATYNRKTPVSFGVLTLEGNTISQFVEKPTLSHWVSMGVYAFNKQVTDYIQPNCLYGFDRLMQALLSTGASVQAFPFEGYWMDIGCVEDYEQAILDLKANPSLLLPNATRTRVEAI